MTNGNFGEPPFGSSGDSATPGGAFGPGAQPVRPIADFGAALDVFKTLMGQLWPTGLLGAYGLLAVASIVANVPLWVSQYLRVHALERVMAGDYGGSGDMLLANALGGLTGLLMVVVIAARLGLAKPMRMVVLEGPQTVTGTGAALQLALSGFPSNLGITIVYLLAISAGSCLCFIPGIIAAVLLYPALYLVATGRDFGGSLSTSVDWVSRHTGALLGTVGVLFAIGLVLGCCNCGVSGAVTRSLGPMTVVYLMPAGTILGEALSVVTLTFVASGCIAADQAESGASAPGGPGAPTGPF